MITTRRLIQLNSLSERAAAERVRHYIAAGKASSIDNYSAASYFCERARKWEGIRIRADRILIKQHSAECSSDPTAKARQS